jgi:hypothetical protein
MRDAGTIWLVPVDPAADHPLGAPIAVSDGAISFALLDPSIAGGDALMTFDAAQKLRRYSLDELSDGLSAAELKRERVASPGSVWGFDRRGRRYLANGTNVEVRDGDKLLVTHQTPLGVHGIFPAPDGERLIILAANQNGIASARAVDSKGKELWTATAPRGVFLASWSADGSRAVLHTQGGAAVVDGKTGRRVTITAGWAFGRTTELPAASPANAVPEFGLPE